MRLYLKLLNANEAETYLPEEMERLLSCLRAAPGMEEVADLSRHPEGGYAAVVMLREGSQEPFVEHLWDAGYRLAI